MLRFLGVAMVILCSSLIVSTLTVFTYLALTEGKNKK